MHIKTTAIASTTKAQTLIITKIMLSLQQADWDDWQEKILLPPTDPNAEIIEIPGYQLVYVNGACPRNYRVYKANSMIGLVFQHLTHWSNEVDSLRYAQAVDAAVGLNNFIKVAGKSTTDKAVAA